MIYSSEAIVLENKPYGEADLIVTYFTKEYGILSLFAKSPRKIKSRFGSSLEPLTYSKISFIGREEKLQRIIQSDILYPFQKLRENYRVFIKLAEILRLIMQFFPKKDKYPEFFKLFLEVLKHIEKSSKIENYLFFLKVRSLKILGYLPDFELCGQCRKPLKKECYYIQGFILCRDCNLKNDSREHNCVIPLGVVNILNSLLKWELHHLDRVKISENLLMQLESFLEKHINSILKG